MSTPQPSCSTAQEPWPSPQHTPVPTATDVTQACSLPSTVNDLLRSDGISPRNTPKIRNHLRMSMAMLTGLRSLTLKRKSTVAKCLLGSNTVRTSRNVSRLGKELRISRDLGKRYRRKRLQLRCADYLSKEELVLRFLKRPDNAAAWEE